MRRQPDQAVLVTGATGFIGRHVVRRLLTAGRSVFVLTRRRAGRSAAARVAESLGGLGRRVVVIEGDLADATLIERNLSEIRSDIRSVIHCAGETSFLVRESAATRSVQIDGPVALLEMLAKRSLRHWSHVSTAFVCGRRVGTVRESETDVGQEFHNDYERLKLESEIVFKNACRRCGVDLRIFRPSVVIGAAPATAGGTPSNLLLRFVRLLVALARAPVAQDREIRIRALPSARFNIVPVEYVAEAIERLAEDPEVSGQTFHLIAARAPTQTALVSRIAQRLALPHLHLLGPHEPLPNPSPVESRIAKMLLPYRAYLEQDVHFDRAGTKRWLDARGLPAPSIDSRAVDHLIELASRSNRRWTPPPLFTERDGVWHARNGKPLKLNPYGLD